MKHVEFVNQEYRYYLLASSGPQISGSLVPEGRKEAKLEE